MKGKKPLKDIAAELGISPAALSFVLNNKKGVGSQTRVRAAQALKQYGYQIREASSPLRMLRPISQTPAASVFSNTKILPSWLRKTGISSPPSSTPLRRNAGAWAASSS